MSSVYNYYMNQKLFRETRKKILKSVGSHVCHIYCAKPDFIIVGAQKSGTTSLHHILVQHGSLTGSKKKEIHFFDRDEIYERKNAFDHYHTYFPFPHQIPKGNLLFETTPIYLYHPKVAARIHDYNPDMKIIIVLRDPVERALSAWTMYHHHFKTGRNAKWHDPRSFGEAIKDELSGIDNTNYYTDRRAIVRRGIYVDQVERYFASFHQNQILILESKALKQNLADSINLITSFLEIEEEALNPMTLNPSKVDIKSEYVAELQHLREFYRPHNEALFELLGCDFNWND